MVAFLKFVHIGAVAIWMAGLVSLPGLYVQRAGIRDHDTLILLQRVVRHAYLLLMSPAAFVAIASGVALIFFAGVFEAWLSAKLALVGLLALIHTIAGLVIIRLFNDGEVYAPWRFVGVTVLTLGLIVCVLFLALVKPDLGSPPAVLSEPGGLARLVEDINPWRKP